MAEINYIWKPISLDEKWLSVSTIKLDNISPSWFRKREALKENQIEYQRFLERIKRQQAIETGIIERLYDLKQGITETFIKEGFYESYMQHGDTNIHPKKLIDILKDNFDAIDFIFDFVKMNRRISKSFLCELHQLITIHQDTIEVVDQNGICRTVSLLKGKFKMLPNNPKRDDDSVFLYCPPEQVDIEIEKLISIYYSLEERNVSPVIRSAYFHHAFTQIHPFQDGNGRMARLMASLILVKGNLFPFTVLRNEKKEYIEGLEAADNGEYQQIIDLFCKVQIRNIESALNLKAISESNSLKHVVSVLSEKVKNLKSIEATERNNRINLNRNIIFECVLDVSNGLVNRLQTELEYEVNISLKEEKPNGSLYYYFSKQIAEYAIQHSYYFNASLPRGWVRINLRISEKKNYNLIISLHHYGYDDNTLALGAFLEFIDDNVKMNQDNMSHYNRYVNIPIGIEPLTMSVEVSVDKLETSIKSFLEDVFTVAIAHITNEI